jgi:hypothetical protein
MTNNNLSFWYSKDACDTLSNLFGPHMLKLLVDLSDKEEKLTKIYSGFLIADDNFVAWITAGHVIWAAPEFSWTLSRRYFL